MVLQAPTLNGVRILCVDDHEDSLQLFKIMLESHGANVLVANNAETALSLMLGQIPDVLLSDICMPGMDGLTLLRTIRLLGRVPAVAVSAHASDNDAVISGFNTLLTKPIDEGVLIETIRKAAGR